MMTMIASIQSEWMKRKRSAATYLTIAGGLFIPIIMLIVRLSKPSQTLLANSSDNAWDKVFNQSWQFMSMLLLPIGITLAVSLIVQIEYRNNAWKQVLTSPQSLTNVFVSKLAVILFMLVQFFIVFNLGIYLTGVLPAILMQDIPMPLQAYPFKDILYKNLTFFIYCLPIVSLQFLLSIHIKNFVLPLSIGLALMIASIISISWQYGYVFPYSYSAYQYLLLDNKINPNVNLFKWSLSYTIFFTALNYLLFTYRYSCNLSWWRKPKIFKTLVACFIGVFFISMTALMPAAYKRYSHMSSNEKISQIEKNIGFVKYKIKNKNYLSIEERMKSYGINGLSIAIIENYKIEAIRHYGYAAIEDNKLVTDETLFMPGSISKSLNAFAFMQLHQDKKINLFTDINHYLTAWKFPYDSIAQGRKITISQLLSHSAGLNVHGFGFEAYKTTDQLPSAYQILNGIPPARNQAVRSIQLPGQKFSYSGGGTMVSQQLLMDYSKQDYATYMSEHILSKLKMKNSFFYQPPPQNKIQNCATGYTMLKEGDAIEDAIGLQPALAAAGLWTNAHDLANYVIEVQKGLNGKSQLLNKNTAHLMLTPYNDEAATMGFFIDTRNGNDYLKHEAGNPGYSGMIFSSTTTGQGIVILANYDGGGAIFEEIISATASLYDWPGFQEEKKEENYSEVASNLFSYQDIIGSYKYDNGVVHIFEKEGKLYYNNNENANAIHFINDSTFINLEGKSKKILCKSNNGLIELKIVDEKNKVKKLTKLIPISIKEISDYTGSYIEDDKESATLFIKENALWIKSENSVKPNKINFVSKHDFYIADVNAILTFVLNKNGKATAIKSKINDTYKTILTKVK